jgi:NADPH:quinone reductase
VSVGIQIVLEVGPRKPAKGRIVMNAICVTQSRDLEVREVPAPATPPIGHILIDVAAAAINHGDKFFLSIWNAEASPKTSLYDVWGASASGRVRAIGQDVPAGFAGKNVALYRSLTPSPQTVGMWSERAVVPYTNATILPENVSVEDYCGSLVNAVTAYAFLEEIATDGHKGVIATAGTSATGLALAAIARRKNIPAILLVRSEASRQELRGHGVEHVLNTASEGFENELERLAGEFRATAVFDGVGGELITRIAPHLPLNSSISFYGFLGGSTPVSVPSRVFMMKNLTMKRFSNFFSSTVADREKLRAALTYLSGIIEDPMFRTRLGKRFRFDQISEAIAYEATPGAKAILQPNAL